jgi:hypothetical protein
VQQKELGFILKRFLPNKQKLSVLALNKGKIELTTQPINKITQLWPGMMINFNLTPFNKKVWIAKDIEIIMHPIKNDFCDLSWLHKILELSYYFLPLEQPCPEIFAHIYNSFLIVKFEPLFYAQIGLIKRIYLLKFFTLVGFYPEGDLEQYFSFYDQLTLQSVDFENIQQVESLKRIFKNITALQIRKMDTWLISCIKSHPHCNYFKTNKIV